MDKALLKNPIIFAGYARLKGVDKKIKAGEYSFEGGPSTLNVLGRLENGECKKYKITLIEGWTIAQMADYLANGPFANLRDSFLSATNDRYFVKQLGLDVDSAEGYLFPDTYIIERPYGGEWLVKILVEQFHRVYPPEFDARAKELGFTKNQVVTLASIIEKETGSEAERPFISSVFHNRLKRGMLLQSDPTIIYGLKNFDGNLRKADLSNPHLYNTYVYAGLPPGPIANPGLASIKAALWPANTEYLYFVSRNDGTHEFSRTLAQHSKAVGKFQRKF